MQENIDAATQEHAAAGAGKSGTWRRVDVTCDHCDGEGTEVVMGDDGYEDGTCSYCNGSGKVRFDSVHEDDRAEVLRSEFRRLARSAHFFGRTTEPRIAKLRALKSQCERIAESPGIDDDPIEAAGMLAILRVRVSNALCDMRA